LLGVFHDTAVLARDGDAAKAGAVAATEMTGTLQAAVRMTARRDVVSGAPLMTFSEVRMM
jgi:hypothetical protein